LKLHADTHGSLNTVTAYGPGFVEVNRRRHAGALIVRPDGDVLAWDADAFEALSPRHFEALLGHAPEVVLLGTGTRQRFPSPALWASLARARVGLEVMDTGAACRTYNILMGEGRRVLAALLPL